MKQYTRVCARIDLDAIEYNMQKMRENIDDSAQMIAVIKCDGYGHGSGPIAKLLEEKEYVWGFATASLEEALLIRRAGITKPVLVLGAIFPEQREGMIQNEIRMACYTEEMARETSELAVKMGKKAYIHLKLDTGMSRIGFLTSEESVACISRIAAMPGLELEGLFTHFSKSDERDKAFTDQQLERYLWMRDALAERGIEFAYCHCSNSAGIIDVREANLDLVRAGIALYGLYPSDEVEKARVPLRPALELISHVAHVKWVDAGTPVSYGGTYVTDRATKIATVPVGYGDGYPRSLSNRGYVLIHGQRAPILGRVCMDQMMVDVTEIDNVAYGDKIVLIGREGDEFLPVETLSELSGRFNYEFVCDLGMRIPREYLRHGVVMEQIDYFEV
ncbi:MAG: alanine racemase [Eubacteriales bacterium]|nr:alanine racemase [Eubacteriales bacterium]